MSVWKRNENEFAPPPPPPRRRRRRCRARLRRRSPPPPVPPRRRASRASGCRHHRTFHRHQGRRHRRGRPHHRGPDRGQDPAQGQQRHHRPQRPGQGQRVRQLDHGRGRGRGRPDRQGRGGDPPVRQGQGQRRRAARGARQRRPVPGLDRHGGSSRGVRSRPRWRSRRSSRRSGAGRRAAQAGRHRDHHLSPRPPRRAPRGRRARPDARRRRSRDVRGRDSRAVQWWTSAAPARPRRAHLVRPARPPRLRQEAAQEDHPRPRTRPRREHPPHGGVQALHRQLLREPDRGRRRARHQRQDVRRLLRPTAAVPRRRPLRPGAGLGPLQLPRSARGAGAGAAAGRAVTAGHPHHGAGLDPEADPRSSAAVRHPRPEDAALRSWSRPGCATARGTTSRTCSSGWRASRWTRACSCATACASTASFASSPPPGSSAHSMWVFGYGSLVWRPSIPFVEREPAWIDGLRAPLLAGLDRPSRRARRARSGGDAGRGAGRHLLGHGLPGGRRRARRGAGDARPPREGRLRPPRGHHPLSRPRSGHGPGLSGYARQPELPRPRAARRHRGAGARVERAQRRQRRVRREPGAGAARDGRPRRARVRAGGARELRR